MIKKSVQDAIKKGIEKDIYKSVALVRIDENGKRVFLIPHSHNPTERFEHIKISVDKSLSPGNYCIECKTGKNSNTLTDKFPFEIKEPVMISLTGKEEKENIIDSLELDNKMNENISFEDYVQLIKDKERLIAQNALLLTQLEIEQNKNKNISLNDSGAGQTIQEKIIGSLSDNLPTVLNIFDRYMNQRDKDLQLREQAMNIKSGKTTIKNNMIPKNINKDQMLNYLENLSIEDPEEFEKSLDDLKESDLDMYCYCLDKLGLEEETEEE